MPHAMRAGIRMMTSIIWSVSQLTTISAWICAITVDKPKTAVDDGWPINYSSHDIQQYRLYVCLLFIVYTNVGLLGGVTNLNMVCMVAIIAHGQSVSLLYRLRPVLYKKAKSRICVYRQTKLNATANWTSKRQNLGSCFQLHRVTLF